ncbi:hypothetical protein K7432_001294 [Basidiobolus ranarum]|uniref:Uncharacterized protein n=1 Tax=Basidiobolus ranarum TaxID=34480 RepID=A0ABR2X3I5_9FUNG
MYAMSTPHITQWGTSAHSACEMRNGNSFLEWTSHVLTNILWFIAFVVGVDRLLWVLFGSVLVWLILVLIIALLTMLYGDITKLHLCCCSCESDLEKVSDSELQEKLAIFRLINVDNSSWPTHNFISKESHSHHEDEGGESTNKVEVTQTKY